MDIEVTKILVPAITGLLAGALGSLIAPWVNWGIEKKRKALEYKQSLIKEVRQLVDKAETLEEILSSSLWGFIEVNLTENEKHSVTSGRILHVPGYDGLSELHMRKQKISTMLSRLEEKWQLNT